jgi:UDP-N-acetyl-D-glucosamine dehydrogenase
VAKLQRVAVIGQGYVGLPLSIAAAESGLQLTGIDIDQKKIESIQSFKSPVEDISDQRIQSATASGNFRATTDFAKVSDAEAVVICVPTPLDGNLEPDLTALKSAVIAVAPYLKEETLIISESTSFPGTLRNVIMPLVKEKYSGDFSQLHFASAPERVNPGDLKWDIMNTPSRWN